MTLLIRRTAPVPCRKFARSERSGTLPGAAPTRPVCADPSMALSQPLPSVTRTPLRPRGTNPAPCQPRAV